MHENYTTDSSKQQYGPRQDNGNKTRHNTAGCTNLFSFYYKGISVKNMH